MSIDISGLEARYLDSCKRHEVEPNSAVLSWLNKAKFMKFINQKCVIVVLLDYLKDADFSPLIDVFTNMNTSDIDAVDIFLESPCVLNEELVMSLMRSINLKLRIVDFKDLPFKKGFMCALSQGGLACQVLNLRSSEIRKLSIVGEFMQLHTLNLDFCTSLTTLQKDCFSCMPNLTSLSMCETRVANLWTSSAALSNLPSLVELKFQTYSCLKDNRPCPSLSSEIENLRVSGSFECQASGADEAEENLISSGDSCSVRNGIVGFTNHFQGIGELEFASDDFCILDEKVSFGKSSVQDKEGSPSMASKKYISHHPSPICFEKNYREFMVVTLPCLEVLDNCSITKLDREMARTVFSECYEYLPYKRQRKESVASILHTRETGASSISRPSPSGNSQYFYSRSLSAAKVGSSVWPHIHTLSNICHVSKEGGGRLRPRQLEYHPSESCLMAFGTLDGEVVVINHENSNVLGYVPSCEATTSVLGLCWLKNYPSKLLAGFDNGSLRLYDIKQMLPQVADRYYRYSAVTYDDFEQLTSVHVNSTNDQFLTSGYSKNVALYDIGSGKRLNLFTDMHREPINVTKFSHHSPSIFVTSSFDRDVKMWDLRVKPMQPCYTASSSRGNVMVCFSPDDLYLLVSAVDNEVKQLLAVDGRVHTNFEIASSGSAHNYTRSYYMNGRDYVISGSCDESIVRICCAQTGRRLRDVHLEAKGLESSMFVQSLRGDPFRDFNMAILATQMRPSSKWEIIKVNLLASSQCNKDYSYCQHCPSNCLGG